MREKIFFLLNLIIKIFKNKVVFLIGFIGLTYLIVLLWRYVYLNQIELYPLYDKDIFRGYFRENLVPLYGFDTSFLLNFKSIFLNGGLFISIYFCFNLLKKRKVLYTSLFFMLIVYILSLKNSKEIFLGNVSHYSTFSEDIHKFNSVKEIFSDYTKKQPFLSIHNGHYPPTYLSLLKTFNIYFIKIMHYLLIIPIIFMLSKLHLFAKEQPKNMLTIALIPALVIFPCLDFVLVPSLLFLICMYLIINKIKYYEYYLGTVFSLWLLISFHLFIAGLFIIIYILYHRKNYTIKKLFLLFTKSLLTIITIQFFVFFISNFNVIECFLTGFHQNNIQHNGNSFDSFSRYFLRSSGNLLSFILGFGPLCAIIIYQLIFEKVDQITKINLITLILLSFGGLYFLETDRVWYIFYFPFLPLISNFLYKSSKSVNFVYITFACIYLIFYELLSAQ